jgi:alkylation response protein AidB-like acyl-CoA dehydrogenase
MSMGLTHTSDAARLIQAAFDLGPTINAMRDEIERERRLPARLVETLRKLDFFSLWVPKDFGGPELSLTDYVRVIEALAQYDGSVAWCVMNAAAYSRFSGFLPEAVARRIFVDDRAVVAGNMGPQGRAEAVKGGYRVTGHWAYGSGIMHSEWVLGGCVVHDGDEPRRGPGGAFETTIVFFPAGEAQVIDNWEVGGLRGTGSHDYQVADLFVPETHASAGRTSLRPGPLYALPLYTQAPVPIAAVPLGIARAALDVVRELGTSRTPRLGSVLLRERPVVQSAIGRAEAMLRAARAFLFEACEEAWSTVAGGSELSLEQRAKVRLSCAQVADTAKSVVQIAYDIGGGTAVYESCPLQRCFRDMHAAVQHVQVQSGNFETGGRVLLGLEPGTWRF